jgi:glycosyltransferase involved in cell wall biosynthesis
LIVSCLVKAQQALGTLGRTVHISVTRQRPHKAFSDAMLADDKDDSRPAEAKPTRTLFVMPLATQRGGAELSLLQLLEYRDDARLEPIVAFLEPGPMLDWCHDHSVRAGVIDAGRLREARRFGRSVRAIVRLAAEADVDVVVSWMAKAQLYGGTAAAVAGIPSMWFQPGLPGRRALLDRAATLLPASGVIAVSAGVERAQRRLSPRRATTIVYPAVDLSRFDAGRIGDVQSTRRRLGLPEHGLIFGSAGRLDTWKGFDVLLDAVPAIMERHPTAVFVLVGGPHEFNPGHALELQDKARRLGCGEQIRLVGSRRNPEEWMHAMDVFVHASQNEPFGMVVIEAMALGKAVVASAEGGPVEVITPGIDGLLSPYGEPQALATAINRLLDGPDLRNRMGEAARTRAQDFSVQRYAREFGAAISRAAAFRRQPPDAGSLVTSQASKR